MKSRTKQTSKNISEAHLERVKLDLLSLISHELRTPLTSILGALEVLKEEPNLSTAERNQFVDLAQRNAEKLNITLSQLLDLSKLVSGRLVCRFQEFSLKAILLSQLNSLKAACKERGLSVRLPDGIEELPAMLGDAPRIEQVIRNLFENATKFSSPGGTIEVSLKHGVLGSKLPLQLSDKSAKEVRYLVLEVVNTTYQAVNSDVFKIFSQQENILDRAHEGIGGSLAIGAEVLRQHYGVLHAEVKDDTFRVLMALPVLESEKALLKVLESRIYALHRELGALSLMILEVPAKSLTKAMKSIKASLFRASDSVYAITGNDETTAELAVLMDDCKKEDAPKIVNRLLKTLSVDSAKFLNSENTRVGLVSCPEDSTDPEKLLALARQSYTSVKKI